MPELIWRVPSQQSMRHEVGEEVGMYCGIWPVALGALTADQECSCGSPYLFIPGLCHPILLWYPWIRECDFHLVLLEVVEKGCVQELTPSVAVNVLQSSPRLSLSVGCLGEEVLFRLVFASQRDGNSISAAVVDGVEPVALSKETCWKGSH